jgi:citrate lyase subunit beta/citryl-CoA lyase
VVDFVLPVAPLFVPASRPDRFRKAAASGADAVILDLEDAIAPEDKERAREAVVEHAAGLGLPVIVRVNAVDTPWHDADIAALVRLEGVALMLPKTERPQDIAAVVRRIGRDCPIIALIETAAGLSRLHDILPSNGVVMAAFGSVDFSVDIGCAHERLPLLTARGEIVWRSRAAGRAAPLDGVTTALDDEMSLEADLKHATEMGFGGKLAIHPKQIDAIHHAFTPDDGTVAWARKVLEASSSGSAARLEGEMIDRPVVERARRIWDRWGSHKICIGG